MSFPEIKQNETEAIRKGGMSGGAYLDQIGVTDMARLSKEQWNEFCGKIFQGVCDELRKQADDEIPW